MTQISSPGPLAHCAADPTRTAGRAHVEPDPANRTHFQRDRDRIVHCAASRRLEYKTQVFVNHEGDLFRTRLTHSLEVAQIGRSLARALGLDEDLAEAIALAHDLGHTPFGHAGQDALNACMLGHGGFEHNLQSLRVVDVLEERYGGFDGLNLSFETREGILKRCSIQNAQSLGNLGERFLRRRQSSLEAQVVNLADEIAYNSHDIDDGLRSGLLNLAQMMQVDLFARNAQHVRTLYPDIADKRLVHETVRRIIGQMADDLIASTVDRVRQSGARGIDEVRASERALAGFSDAMAAQSRALKQFLMSHLYRHYQVMRMNVKAHAVVKDLFNAFTTEPRLLPTEHQRRAGVPIERAVADYIAGMTDRYAIDEHERLFAIGRR